MYPHHDVFLPLCEVQRRTGLSRSTIYEKISEGTFPRQVKVGPRGVRWLERDITAWIQSCLDASASRATAQKTQQKKTQQKKTRLAQDDARPRSVPDAVPASSRPVRKRQIMNP